MNSALGMKALFVTIGCAISADCGGDGKKRPMSPASHPSANSQAIRPQEGVAANPTPEQPAPASAATTADVANHEALKICDDYSEVYCGTDDEDEWQNFEDLSEEDQEAVLDECVGVVGRADDQERQSFGSCIGELADCMDASHCLIEISASLRERSGS